MIGQARAAALRALAAIERRTSDLPAALAASRRALDDARDRALAAEIITGTVRWQAALDHVIDAIAGGKPIEPDVRLILRLSAYQLLHLDRVPASAVVNDAVNLARAAQHGRAAGFVNAVLRTISRSRQKLPLPPRPGENADRETRVAYLSITCSHPRWLVERWLDRVGFDVAEAWTTFNNAPAPVTLRANRFTATRDAVAAALAAEGVPTQLTRFAPDGLEVESGAVLHSAAFERGDCGVQDEASQLVAEMLLATPGARVLDVCAAPGGKTLLLAGRTNPGGRVVAVDVRRRRIALLASALRRERAPGVFVVQADAARALPFGGQFDAVLVDAPCSGLGTLRRDPDVRWRRSAAELGGFRDRQQAILEEASRAVRPGGALVYATCSSEPEENDAVVDAFLATNAGFREEDPRSHSPCPAGLAATLDERGRLRTAPHLHRLEMFFAARLVRIFGENRAV